MKKRSTRLLAMLLAMLLVVSLLPVSAFAEEGAEPEETVEALAEEAAPATEKTEAAEEPAEEVPAEEPAEEVPAEETDEEEEIFEEGEETVEEEAEELVAYDLEEDSFYKMVLIDCGRGYYTVDQIKAIIDKMALCGYKYLMLGFGNDGLRFLLDDMSVTANGTTYSGTTITNAIIAKNDELAPNAKGQWTQSDMDGMLAYANAKGIQIVPMIDVPGHATSITAAMTACGINAALSNRNNSTDSGSTTFDVTNTEATEFAKALLTKYINYFRAQGARVFNLGMDEYAGNNGGWKSMSDAEQAALGTFLNEMSVIAANTGMYTMAFCDVIGNLSSVPETVIGINWNGGYLKNGHRNVNANQNWYYVLGASGNTSTWAAYEKAMYYTENASVTTTVGGTAGAGCLLAIWNDNYLAADNYIDEIENLIYSQASNNPAYFTIREERDVTVAVNDTYSEAVTADSITTAPDSSIATAALTTGAASDGYTKVSKITSGKQYLLAVNTNYILTSLSASNDWSINGFRTTSATVSGGEIAGTGYDSYLWTITETDSGYTIQNSSGAYLAVNEAAADVKSWGTNYPLMTQTTPYYFTVDAANGTIGSANNSTIYLNNFGGANTCVAAYTGASTITFYEKNASGNELTIKGVAVGTTTAVVGNTTYNITVVAEDLSKVSITYYPFIADFAVYPQGTGAENCSGTEGTANAQTLKANVNGVNSENGIAVADFAWAEGDWRWEGSSTKTVLWKGVVHAGTDTKQVGTTFDCSTTGTDFNYIRYYEGTWAVSADRKTWTAVDTANDEVCVYYMQETDLTEEVTTYVKDWAFTTADYSSYYSNDKGHKALSFSVVYPGGQMSPSEDDIYSKTTLIYWANTGATNETDTMLIRAGVNSIYEIEKVTYTYGTIESESATGGSISWNKTTTDDVEWYDETVYTTSTDGGDVVVRTGDFCAKGTGKFESNGQAVLILIYLKPVVTEDSLTVVYQDDSANTEIMSYALNIKNESTEVAGTFLNRLVQTSAVQAGVITLDDAAYVVNYVDKRETFEKNLTKIPSLMGKYASGLYNYTGADISADGKTLTLHYNLDESKLEATYVLDFGLPVEIKVSTLTEGNVKAVTVQNGNVGTATATTDKITYSLTKALSGTDTIRVKVTYTDNSTTEHIIGFIPATTVYYEEGFAEFTGTWSSTGSKGTATQTASKPGDKATYGYDAAYAGSIGVSNGTAATTSTKGAYASFTFTGTGIDIYANGAAASGDSAILVKVKENSSTVKFAIVHTTTSSNYCTQTNGQSLGNMPVFSTTGLAYGTYTVVLSSTANAELSIDGFRVYGSLQDQNAAEYVADLEDKPVFVELRDYELNQLTIPEGSYYEQVYTVVNAELSDGSKIAYTAKTDMSADEIAKLLNDGPKNELFVLPNTSITFKLTTTRQVQLGMKAYLGAATATVNGTAINVNSSTDMFYKISPNSDGTVTVANNSSNVLSITKLKICDDPSAALAALTAEDIALAMAEPEVEEVEVTAPVLETAPVPVSATVSIAVKANGETIATAELSKSGTAGEEAVFTAEEVQAAVEAVLPEGYTLEESCGEVSGTYGAATSLSVSAVAEESPAEPEEESKPNEPEKNEEPAPVAPEQPVFNRIVKAIRNVIKSLFGFRF